MESVTLSLPEAYDLALEVLSANGLAPTTRRRLPAM